MVPALKCSRAEFVELRALQLKRRWDWPAAFSTNWYQEIWPFVKYSLTPESLRVDVRGASSLLDELADLCLQARPEGGRFFINDTGAYFRDQDRPLEQFVAFAFSDGPVVRHRKAVVVRHETSAQRAQRHHTEGHCDQSSCVKCLDELEQIRLKKESRQLSAAADKLLGDKRRWKKRWER